MCSLSTFIGKQNNMNIEGFLSFFPSTDTTCLHDQAIVCERKPSLFMSGRLLEELRWNRGFQVTLLFHPGCPSHVLTFWFCWKCKRSSHNVSFQSVSVDLNSSMQTKTKFTIHTFKLRRKNWSTQRAQNVLHIFTMTPKQTFFKKSISLPASLLNSISEWNLKKVFLAK